MFLFAASAIPALAAVQPEFTEETGVRLSSPAFHIEQISTGYRMYFSSSDYFVMSATSTDGLAWGVESGVRISTQAGYYDASSITAFGMMYNPADYPSYPYVAYYVGIDIDGNYNLLRATSTDGLLWGKSSSVGVLMQQSSYINSPRPYRYDNTHLKLYYTRDSVGSGALTDSKMYVLNSIDHGKTFSGETSLLPSATAYSVCFSTTAPNKMHVYYTTPASGESVASIVKGLTSYNNGLAFVQDSGVGYSTSSAKAYITGCSVVRSTESYRWRMYPSMQTIGNGDRPYVHSLLTKSPYIQQVSPNGVYQTSNATTFTVTGEIFSDTISSFTFASGTSTMTVSSWTRDSDTQLSVVANPNGVSVGNYTATVINSDGYQFSLANAVNVDIAPGDVALTENLFRPLHGERCKIDMTVYGSGDAKIKVYTRTGRKVKTVCDGNITVGTTTYYWDGTNDNGETVASGLYLMVISGPRLDSTQKVVVIK